MDVCKTTTDVSLDLDEKNVVPALRDIAKQLNGSRGQVILNFAGIKRIDSTALQALEELVHTAEQKGVKVALRGVDVYVYRVLKLMKLASRLSFVNSEADGKATE